MRGTIVHELLEALDLRPAPRCRTPRRSAPSPPCTTPSCTDADVDDLRAMVAAFAGSALRERLGAARAVHREQAFAFALGRRADAQRLRRRHRATRATARALIVDYKSDRVGDADLDALVEADYATQRRIYALAALRAGAPAVEVAHLFLERPGEPAVARYEQRRRRGARRASCATPRRRCWPASTRSPRSRTAGCARPARAAAGLCSYPPELTRLAALAAPSSGAAGLACARARR